MNKEEFIVYFSKLFFINLKDNSNIRLHNFRNENFNNMFIICFKKLNNLKQYFDNRQIGNNSRQRRRLMAIFRKVVSIWIYVVELAIKNFMYMH